MVLWEFFHARFYLVVGKPAALSFRTGSPPETGESASELSPSGSDEDEPWRWDRFCRQAASAPEPDRDARLRARRKLCIACGVSLVFMAGEMMGEQKSNLVIPQPFPEGGKNLLSDLAPRLQVDTPLAVWPSWRTRCIFWPTSAASPSASSPCGCPPGLPQASWPSGGTEQVRKMVWNRGPNNRARVADVGSFCCLRCWLLCAQRSWPCCCQLCPSGLWRQPWSRLPSRGSSMETTTSTAGSCSSPQLVPWESMFCEYDELVVEMCRGGASWRAWPSSRAGWCWSSISLAFHTATVPDPTSICSRATATTATPAWGRRSST